MFTKRGDNQPIEILKLDDVNDQETKTKLDTLKEDLSDKQAIPTNEAN